MKQPWEGHRLGAEKLHSVLEWCREFGIRELTLYAFSLQNFNRPQKEFAYLMELFEEEFSKLLAQKEKLAEEGIRIRFIGRIDRFPKALAEKMRMLMAMTEHNDRYVINFAMAYGGREEIIDSVKTFLATHTIDELDERSFTGSLWLPDEPELIIRTGGEMRTSNFLPWQSIYSEWFFLEKTWPEFGKEDLSACIASYMGRDRRFGR